MPSKHPTTVRLDPALYKEVLRLAEKAGLNFSNVLHLLLNAYVAGNVQIGVTQYPTGYIEALSKEADELRRQHRKGKTKSYASSKALFDDILDR